MTLFQRYRDAIVCVVLLGLPFYYLRASTRSPGHLGEIDRAVVALTSPLHYVGTTIADGIFDVWDRYVYLIHVRRDNERLRAEAARSRADAQRYRDAYEENRRLRRLLQLRVETPIESWAAQVVARDTTPFFRVNRVAIAADHGRARDGMPVITYDGLVGKIDGVVGRYANVTLVADTRSAVDAMVERTGARGIVHGTGEQNRYSAQLAYLQRTDDVRVGDTVVTSGLGCRFPPGLLVGRVSAVTRQEFGLYQEVDVTPAVDFSRLGEVLVLVVPPADCRPGLLPTTQRRTPARSGGTP